MSSERSSDRNIIHVDHQVLRSTFDVFKVVTEVLEYVVDCFIMNMDQKEATNSLCVLSVVGLVLRK